MVQDKTILGVLRINDKDGIIDDYIWCLLRFLKEYAQDVAVVCTARKVIFLDCYRIRISYTRRSCIQRIPALEMWLTKDTMKYGY